MRLTHSLGLGCCLALASLADAQNPTTPTQPATPAQQPVGGTTAAPLQPALYQMGEVNKSLQLTQDQINRLNGVTEDVQKQYAQQFEKLGKLNADEQFARAMELNRLYMADWSKSAANIMNNQQRTRYQQLTHQFGGFNTLYDPEFQRRMNLTPAQVQNLRANVEWSTGQFGTINTVGATDSSKGTQQYQMFMKEREQRFNKLLTPEQQKTWREMTGEPHTFQPAFGPKR